MFSLTDVRNFSDIGLRQNVSPKRQLKGKVLIPLSKHLWESAVPFVVCRSIGFLGYIRLQVKEHTVIEAHPDNDQPDLRLLSPWRSLKEHLESIDVPMLDPKTRSHVPAIVILYYYLNKYKELNGGSVPKTRKEKEILKKMIRDNPVADEGNIRMLEENFEEAIRYVNTCLNSPTIPLNVKAILDDDCCKNLTQNSSPFWIMCAALKEFLECENSLPIKGSLPDMAADTTSYITLQQLYHKQAEYQAEVIYRRASDIARDLGLPMETITQNEVKLFCKHASELQVVQGSCIADEYEKTRLDLSFYLEDPDSLMFYYVILRGLERFISEFNTYPGQFDDQVEPDVLKLKSIIGKLLSEWSCSQVLRDERVHEVCRYGGAEIHSVSAVLGGCAAHEVIKLITHQYKPLNNAFIYDAISSNSATFCL